RVPNDRGQCCHVGGDIDFDAAGNLYLTTGDDTNPFESGGYSPLDERTNRNPQYDAQRSSANTNDLRGKLLRIHPEPDGTYTIPAGNLFAPGTARTRPEIYAMGFRNPFRMSVDKATGTVYVGDYGPDAGTASASRGPAGQVEFNRITTAGNQKVPFVRREGRVGMAQSEEDPALLVLEVKVDADDVEFGPLRCLFVQWADAVRRAAGRGVLGRVAADQVAETGTHGWSVRHVGGEPLQEAALLEVRRVGVSAPAGREDLDRHREAVDARRLFDCVGRQAHRCKAGGLLGELPPQGVLQAPVI